MNRILMLVLAAAAGWGSNAHAGPAAIELFTQENLNWETTPEGVAFAALDGNRFEESYMAMVRLPAGLVSPVHIKSAAMHGVIVSGEMIHLSEHELDQQGRVLTVGDYYEIPADLPHLSKCVSSSDCVTFLYQDGPFDFLPVQGDRQ